MLRPHLTCPGVLSIWPRQFLYSFDRAESICPIEGTIRTLDPTHLDERNDALGLFQKPMIMSGYKSQLPAQRSCSSRSERCVLACSSKCSVSRLLFGTSMDRTIC